MRILLLMLAVSCGACPTPGTTTPDPSGQSARPAQDDKRTQPVPERGSVVVVTSAGEIRFPVELAVTPAERGRGLMFREHLDDNAGMLFLFERTQLLSFWMKNTHIPLDMIFIDEDLTIAGIVENTEPMTLTSRRIDKPSRFVLELNAGACRRLGVVAGQKVRFDGVPTELFARAPPPPSPSEKNP